MRSWDLRAVELRPRSPEILSSSDEARAVVLEILAGESLHDHQVDERAWVSVIDGEVEITTGAEENVAGGAGLMVKFAPGERHAVRALTTVRLRLLMTPWPGDEPSRDDAAQRQGDGQAARSRTPSEPVTTVHGTGSPAGSVLAPRRSCGLLRMPTGGALRSV